MEKPIDILLVEDDIDDVDLLKEALSENNILYNMTVIMEGDKVITYLEGVQKLPQIIVMDLNLPKTGGKEILHEMKRSVELTEIPVVILTTSSSLEDIHYCSTLGVNKFITKPATIDGWNATIRSILTVVDGKKNNN